MMANYDRVVELIEKMEREEYVKFVEIQLERLSEDPLFLNLLVVTIRDRTTGHNVKLGAAVLLNKTICSKYQEFQQDFLIDILLTFMLDCSVNIKYKQAVQNAFVSLLELAQQQTVQRVLDKVLEETRKDQEAIVEEAHEIIEERSKSISDRESQNINVLFFVYKCVLDSSNHLLTLVSHFQGNLKSILKKVPIIYEIENMNILEKIAEFIAMFMENLTQSRQYEILDFVEQFCSNEILIRWLFNLLALRGIPDQCWISSNREDDHVAMNNLKTKAAELHQRLLSHFAKSAIEGIFIPDKHYECSGILMNTLIVYATFPDVLSTYDSFVTALIRNLLILFRINQQHFTNLYTSILHSILFPLISIKQLEQQTFEKDPEQFNRLAEDCCDHQKFGILKSEVSMFLEILCDEYEAAAQYVIQHCIISLKVRLALDENFEASAKNFLSIETALLVLSIQSYRLCKHPKQMEEIKKAIEFEHAQSRLTNLQLCRLFTFLAYNYSQLYKNPIEGDKWIKYSLQADKHPTVELAAVDFISNVVQDYFNIEFIINFANKITSKKSMYLSAFIKIIGIHLLKVQEKDMIVIVDILYQVINREIRLYESRNKSHTMDIVSCLHLLKKMLDSGEYCTDKPNLKAKIWEVLNFMPAFEKISLDDELIRILISYINKELILTEPIVSTIRPLINLYLKEKQESTVFLIYFNSIIMKNDLNSAQLIGCMLIQNCQQLHRKIVNDPKVSRTKISMAGIIVILQNIIALYGNSLGPHFIGNAVQLSLSMIPEADNPEDKIDLIIVARALNLLFLCHMHNKDERALRRLLVFQDSPIFQGYDLRVLCICLCKEIFRETDLISVTELINIMVKAITLSKEEKVVIKSKKNPMSVKTSSTKIKIRRIEDYEQLIRFIKTPFPPSSLPELEIKVAIETMKKNNPYLYQSIVKSLTKTIYEKLKGLMSEVVVQGRRRKVIHPGNPKDTVRINTQNIIRGAKKRNYASSDEDDKEEQIQSKKKNHQKKKLKEEHFRQKQQNQNEEIE